AGNRLVADDALDAVDRGLVAPRRERRALLAEQALELEVAVVERAHEVRGRAPGLAPRDRARLEHHHARALRGEDVGGREPRDPQEDVSDVVEAVDREETEEHHVLAPETMERDPEHPDQQEDGSVDGCEGTDHDGPPFPRAGARRDTHRPRSNGLAAMDMP